MNEKVINMDEYPRIDHFNFFRYMDYPFVGLTINIDITNFLKHIKRQGYSFFHSFLYTISNAANGVPQLRQRIRNDEIVEFSHCSCSYTVAMENEMYCYCNVDCNMPLNEFIPYAKKLQQDATKHPDISNNKEKLSMFFVSSLPWHSYTALIQPLSNRSDSNPRITWGKYFEQDGKTIIPVSILCHHALVDGAHLSHFYNNLIELLKQY